MGSSDSTPRSSESEETSDGKLEHWTKLAGGDAADSVSDVIASCRAYLLLVANQELDPRLRPKVAPSDVMQKTFVDAQEKFAGFRGRTREELQAWLRRILLNNLVDVRRRFYDAEKRSITREQSVDGDSRIQQPVIDLADAAISPRASMIAREDVALVREALDRLTEDQQKAVVLRSFERLSFSEVGERMDRSEDAARKLWCRAIERLQQELVGIDEEGTS